MKTAVAVTLAAAVLLLGLLTLFGDNVRRTFAMSADSMAGGDEVAYQQHVANSALTKKKLLNFGMNDSYAPANTHVAERPNPWTSANEDAKSTFAIDVDTASYTLARRTLLDGYLPVKEGVRVEEWVNAFAYQLDAPKGAVPFSVGVEGAPSPFSPGRTLLKVSLQGRAVKNEDRKPAHLVFLVDTSGSMQGPDRLGLAQESLRILTKHLNPRDTVALVTYAGDVRDVLPPTPAEEQQTILGAIDALSAGGSTAMGSGLALAYRHAARHVAPGHVSRVIVLTDGDANVGAVGAMSMLDAVAAQVKKGVTLTTVGFGMGNYRDHTLEQLANKGNGQSVYIDSLAAAKKVFGQEVSGTLEVIAKDVKIQVAFDPSQVLEYRLLGYENRDVKDADFRKDDVDGGEIGAGHSVTALYEVQRAPGATGALGTVFVRGKQPDESEAFEVKHDLAAAVVAPTLADASTELKFAAAVAVSADILRGNPAASDWNLAKAIALAQANTRGLAERKEFVSLMLAAQRARVAPVAANNPY